MHSGSQDPAKTEGAGNVPEHKNSSWIKIPAVGNYDKKSEILHFLSTFLGVFSDFEWIFSCFSQGRSHGRFLLLWIPSGPTFPGIQGFSELWTLCLFFPFFNYQEWSGENWSFCFAGNDQEKEFQNPRAVSYRKIWNFQLSLVWSSLLPGLLFISRLCSNPRDSKGSWFLDFWQFFPQNLWDGFDFTVPFQLNKFSFVLVKMNRKLLIEF